MKEKLKDIFCYGLPVFVCAGMFLMWLIYGYSEAMEIAFLRIFIVGYLIYQHKERKEFRMWKRRQLKH